MPRRKQPRRTDVKDIRSILRLTYEGGLSGRKVSERLGLSKSTVSTYLLRAREAGLSAWPMPAGHEDDAALERRLFRQMGRPPRDMTEPDWQLVSRKMKRKGVTLLLLWQEYREAHPTDSATLGFATSSTNTRSVPTRPTGTAMPPVR